MSKRATRILIVDDESFQRLILQGYLTKFGYLTSAVSSGYEALDACKTITPDLILLDLMMPGMDGIETCRKLIELESLENTPIVMLTGKNDTQSIRDSFEAGASDFLTKPINELLLKKRIEYSLHAIQLKIKLQSNAIALTEAQQIAKLGAVKINIRDRSIEISTNGYDLLGFKGRDVTLTFLEFMSYVHPDDKTHVLFTLDHAIQVHDHYMLEYRFLSPNREEIIIFQQGEYIEDLNDSDNSYLLGSFQDVTDLRLAKESFEHSRYYDLLTDLPNRDLFEVQIKNILKHPPKDTLFAVVFLGLDNFSRVNDELGHKGGDVILKEISNRLMKYKSNVSVVCRFGGDVFSMLIKNILHIDECNKILDDLLTIIKQPIIVDKNKAYMTASIGASIFPLESEDEMHLLIGAEAAMMLSREEGGGRFTYRTHRMNLETQKRLILLKEMRVELEAKDFVVYYQPQIDSKNMTIIGMEALVRWMHPEKGLIPPDDFIPVAEESGLIIPIGDFVLEAACAQTKKWLDMGFKLTLGVNISSNQFEADDFIKKIEAALKQTGLPNNNLEVEITESMAMKDHQETVKKLSILRKLNIKTSMDDFGTGYSSLSQLQTLPLDTLKVDQAFVKCIKYNEADNNDHHTYENSAIANAIIVMSHSMGLTVIAEGVETADQCKFLQTQKSEVLQGYLFSKPVPAEDMEVMLVKQHEHDSFNWQKYIDK